MKDFSNLNTFYAATPKSVQFAFRYKNPFNSPVEVIFEQTRDIRPLNDDQATLRGQFSKIYRSSGYVVETSTLQ